MLTQACSTAEKAINGVLDYVSASGDIDTSLMQRFYEETLKSLAEAKNEARTRHLSVDLEPARRLIPCHGSV